MQKDWNQIVHARSVDKALLVQRLKQTTVQVEGRLVGMAKDDNANMNDLSKKRTGGAGAANKEDDE